MRKNSKYSSRILPEKLDFDFYSYLLGRWLGDGIKGEGSFCIARGNFGYEIDSMELIANRLGVNFLHDSEGYSTLFYDCYDIQKHFRSILDKLNQGDFDIRVNDFAFIAGFLDSDGCVEMDNPSTKVGKLESYAISLSFYNNNLNFLNFIKQRLLKYNIPSTLQLADRLRTPLDKCNILIIYSRLGNYFIGSRILDYSLHKLKREKIQKYIDTMDTYYNKSSIYISEIFRSIEGEGRELGFVKTFIRVSGCPHHCSFCDSEYARIAKEKDRVLIKDVIERVIELGTDRIEFTGGSPDQYPRVVGYLLIYFKTHYNSKITMQVSGGIKTIKSKNLFILSDLNAFDFKDSRENIPFVIPKELVRERDEIKFLIRDEFSYNFTKNKIKELQELGISCVFIIIAQTFESEDIVTDHIEKTRSLVFRILSDSDFPTNNIKIIPRLQVLIWGSKRGV